MRKKCIIAFLFLIIAIKSLANNRSIYENALTSIIGHEISVEEINDTPISGLKELTINTGDSLRIIYISNDGKYLFSGNLFEIQGRVDVTATQKYALRLSKLEKFDDSLRLNYFPEKMNHKVSVFIDIDCPNCRKFHQQMTEFNKLGIGISYLFFSSSNLNTVSTRKAVSVWCSKSPTNEFDRAMSGAHLPELQCDNPVVDHYNVGKSVGVSGTPTLILEDGTMLTGFVSPQQLKRRLDGLKNNLLP